MTLTYKLYQLILFQLFRPFAMLGLLNSWSLLIIAFQIQDDIFSVLLFRGRSRVLYRELSQMFRLIKVSFLLVEWYNFGKLLITYRPLFYERFHDFGTAYGSGSKMEYYSELLNYASKNWEILTRRKYTDY